MSNVIEQFTRNGSDRKSWQDRFQNKWPYITTMMHQTEMTLQPQVHIPEYSEDSLDDIYRNPKLPGWRDSNPDIWSDPRSHDILDEDSSTGVGSKQSEERRCERRCRNALCAFLIFSVVSVSIAAIAVSVLLTQTDWKPGVLENDPNPNGGHIDSNITAEEKDFLSKKFCDLVKELLKSVDFPVDTGLDSCNASLTFKSDSDDLHIQMHVAPKKGYTVKEKFTRALLAGKIGDMRSSLTKDEAGSTVDSMENPRVKNLSAEIPLKAATMPGTTTDIPAQTTAVSIKTTTSSSSTTTTPQPQLGHKLGVMERKKNAVLLGSINFGFMQSPTFTKTNTRFRKTTTTHSREYPEQIDLTKDPRDTTLTPTMAPATTTVTPLVNKAGERNSFKPERDDKNKLRASNTKSVNDKSASLNTRDGGLKLIVPTNLFTPDQKRNGNKIVSNINKQPSVPIPANTMAESLMAGGVLRFPLKTSSNFKFLLLGRPKSKSGDVMDDISRLDTQPEVKIPTDPELQTRRTVNTDRKVSVIRTRGSNRPEIAGRFQVSDGGLQRQPSIFRGQMTSQDTPRKRIDVTTFG